MKCPNCDKEDFAVDKFPPQYGRNVGGAVIITCKFCGLTITVNGYTLPETHKKILEAINEASQR